MQIIRQLIEIILRKRQPEDLSYNLNAAIVSILSVVALGYAVYSKMPQITQPLAYNIAMVALQVLGIYGLLAMNQKSMRFVQTATAIFGTSVILQILTIGSGLIPALAPLGLAMTVWNFALIVFIVRSALECKTFKAIALTIGYHLLMGILMVMIFPKFPLELQSILEAASTAVSQTES